MKMWEITIKMQLAAPDEHEANDVAIVAKSYLDALKMRDARVTRAVEVDFANQNNGGSNDA